MNNEGSKPIPIQVGTLTPVTELAAWPEGHSPQDALQSILDDVAEISDVIIIARYRPDTTGEEKYALAISAQATITKLGLLELAKGLCTSG